MLVKIGIPFHDAMRMEQADAESWIETWIEMQDEKNGVKKYKVKRKPGG